MYVKHLTRSKVEVNDYRFNPGGIIKDMEYGFDISSMQGRALSRGTLQTAIAYEMSLTHRHIQRTVYGFLDFLGDLGGLLTAMKVMMLCMVFILHYHGHLLFIMS